MSINVNEINTNIYSIAVELIIKKKQKIAL